MAAATMTSAICNTIASGIAQRPASAGRAPVITQAFFRPAYGYRQRQRCQPKGACGSARGGRMGFGPMGFSSRPLTQSDIDNMMRMVEQFWFGGKAPEGWRDAWGAAPRAEAEGDMPLAVDVQEEEHSFVFTADVPGVSRSDIKVQARKDEQELVISGERAAPAAPEEAEGAQRFRRRTERRFGKFSRTFSLPDNAQLTGITAKFDNGVLTVTVPKSIPAEPEVTDVPINGADEAAGPTIDV